MIRRMAGHGSPHIFLLSVSAGILSVSLLLGLFLAPGTLVLLVASAGLLMVGGFVTLGRAEDDPIRWDEPTRRALWVFVVAQLALLLVLPPTVSPTTSDPMLFRALIGFALGLVVSFLPVPSRGLHDVRIWALVAIYLACGSWVISASPDPPIDVHVLQQMGVQLFLEGQNPYAIRTYPDIYGSGSPFYSPGMAEDGFLTFGFPYTPLSFLLAIPGYVLFGDHRYSLVLAMALAAVLIAATGRGDRGSAPGLLLLFNPGTFYLVEHAWIDPYGVALLGATVFLATRPSSVSAGVVLGLLAVAKQTLVPLIGIGSLLLARLWRGSLKMMFIATLSGAAVSLPLALWSVRDFMDSAVTLQLHQPFRPESLTISAWLSNGVDPAIPVWVAFLAMAGVLVFALFRLPRTPAGFAIAVAAGYVTFFLLNKYAFSNYYLVVLAALCCAIASGSVGPGTPNHRTHRPLPGRLHTCSIISYARVTHGWLRPPAGADTTPSTTAGSARRLAACSAAEDGST